MLVWGSLCMECLLLSYKLLGLWSSLLAAVCVLEVHIKIQKVNWNWQAGLACLDVELAVWSCFL